MTEPTPQKPPRQIVLEIDDAKFVYTVRATSIGASPVKDLAHVAIQAWLFDPPNDDKRVYLVNILSDDEPPHERLGGRMVGRTLVTDEHVQIILYMPARPAWDLFAGVKNSLISHLTLWLEPSELLNEDLVVGYAIAAQEEADLFLDQFDIEG